MVEQPSGWAIGPPPKNFRGRGRKLFLLAYPCLDGDYAALVVDAHEQAKGSIEEYPGHEPVSYFCS